MKSTTSDFITKAKIVHGDTYDYSHTIYNGRHQKLTIKCKTHGEFVQTAGSHLTGRGCPQCGSVVKALKKRIDIATFIDAAKKVHGDKYDYSRCRRDEHTIKFVINCPRHGEFMCDFDHHVKRGQGCRKCADAERGLLRKYDTDSFITKAREIHGDKYDYSKVKYEKSITPVQMICPKHGEFLQKPVDHLTGRGCYKCGRDTMGKKQQFDTDKFIQIAKSVHGDEYDYSKVVYTEGRNPVIINCRKHGDFEQMARIHLKGCKCPKCAREGVTEQQRWDARTFAEKASTAHNHRYDYSQVEYKGSMTKVKILCLKHGEFWQRPDNHINQKHGCPKCGSFGPSNGENSLMSYIANIHPDAIQSDRNVIAPFELDVIVPSLKLAVEFNGIYWHSEKYRDDTYHINKRKMTEQAGYRLISIREDLWNERRPQIEAIISNALGMNTRCIYARKCTVGAADKDTAAAFFDANHVQGNRAASQYWALNHDGETVAVMSATHWRKKDEWELVRYATSCNVVGGLSKLWAHIVKVNNITRAYSYVDRDLFTGRSYAHAGFKYDSTTVGFRIVTGETTESRQKWNNAPDGLTQNEWYEREGVYRMYDSGQDKLIFKR